MSKKDEDQDQTNIWEDCRAGREEQSKILTELLLNKFAYLDNKEMKSKGAKNTFSLNIDAPWGMGKTFFIERWARELRESRSHLTLMFNAWEHDYSKDALTCLLSSLHAQMISVIQKELRGKKKVIHKLDLVAKGMKQIVRRSAPAALSALSFAALGVPLGGVLTKNPDSSGADDAAQKIMENIGEELGNEIFDNRESYENALREFKDSMADLIDELRNSSFYNLPIFIFIDDLDRCRPEFTLEVIECVKHILDIDGIYFIFATDVGQLQHSLAALYGSQFNGEKYLKRIFNRECRLAEPNHSSFANSLFVEEGCFNSQKLSLDRLLFPDIPKSVPHGLGDWFAWLSMEYNLDLRTQLICKDQIEDLLNLRRDTNTLALALMHLVVLWNTNKEEAEKQYKHAGLTNRELLLNKIRRKTKKYTDDEFRSSTTYVSLSDILNWHYTCCFKSFSDLVPLSQRAETEFERQIYRHALKFTSNITQANEPPKTLNYQPMFNQIKLVS